MDIDKFVRDEVRRRLQQTRRGPQGSRPERPDVNIARAVNVGGPGRRTSVSSTQHVVIRDRNRNR
jgi:hypothetical protein